MSELAIKGGRKSVHSPAPHFPWPRITSETESAIVRQLHQSISIYNCSGIFQRFEDAWSVYHGAGPSLLTNSGTSALLSMFVGIDLKPGDEVIVPCYTFHATASPLFFLGALPVLCDCDETGNMDASLVEGLINERTRAVVVTHMWGIPCDMKALRQVCDRHGIFLLEDCSHAHGATINGQHVGTFGDAAAWSLQGQKIVTGGEGGIMCTENRDIYARATLLGHYNKRCKQEIPGDHPLYAYSVTGMGLKLRAHPLAIAMAEEQFSHLDEWMAQKRAFADIMTDRIGRLPGLRPPVVPDGADPAWYAYVLQYRSEDLGGLAIDRFHQALIAEGAVEADLPGSTGPLNWLPLYQKPQGLFPALADNTGYSTGQFPGAEQFAANAIKLPVWAFAEDAELVEQYLSAFEKVVAHHEELLD